MDRAEVSLSGVKAIWVDLADKASIDAAVDECGGPVHALFPCAGVADGTPGIERINFIGHRHLIDRLLDGDLLPRGVRHRVISSAAGFVAGEPLRPAGVPRRRRLRRGQRWAQENGKADYMWSKLAINAYVAREAFGLLKQGVRINAILPGPTDTPLAQANKETWLTFGADYRGEVGIEPSTPLEQAYPLVFLCSDAARGITGITMVTDAGTSAPGSPGRSRRRHRPSSSCPAPSDHPCARFRSSRPPTSGSGRRAPTVASGSRAARTARRSSIRRSRSARGRRSRAGAHRRRDAAPSWRSR